MPFGLLTLVAMPLGLEALPLAVMAWGIDMLLGGLRLGREPARRRDFGPVDDPASASS